MLRHRDRRGRGGGTPRARPARFSGAMLAGRAPGPTRIFGFDEGRPKRCPIPDRSFDGRGEFRDPSRRLAGEAIARRCGCCGRAGGLLPPGRTHDNVAWRLLFDAIRAHGDLDAANAPPSGGNLGTSEAVLGLLRNAGFAVCRAASVHREWLVDEPRDIVAGWHAVPRTAALIAARGPARRAPRSRRPSPRPPPLTAVATVLPCRLSPSWLMREASCMKRLA